MNVYFSRPFDLILEQFALLRETSPIQNKSVLMGVARDLEGLTRKLPEHDLVPRIREFVRKLRTNGAFDQKTLMLLEADTNEYRLKARSTLPTSDAMGPRLVDRAREADRNEDPAGLLAWVFAHSQMFGFESAFHEACRILLGAVPLPAAHEQLERFSACALYGPHLIQDGYFKREYDRTRQEIHRCNPKKLQVAFQSMRDIVCTARKLWPVYLNHLGSAPTDLIVLQEAVRLAGCTEKTIRRRIKDGSLLNYGPRYKPRLSKAEVELKAPTLLKRGQSKGRTSPKQGASPASKLLKRGPSKA